MRGRALLLVLSVFVAAVGTGLIYAYVRSADNRALAEQRPVAVIVAQNDIVQGTPVKGLSLASSKKPAGSLPADALILPDGQKTLDALAQAGSTARIDIKKGDPLLSTYFTSNASSQSSSGGDPNFVKMDLDIEGSHAAAGLLAPDQQVMVLVTIERKPPITRVLLPRAMVLAVNGSQGASGETAGSRVAAAAAAPGTSATVSLSVSLTDAQKLILVQEHKDMFKLYFVAPGATAPKNAQPASISDLS